MLTHAHTRSHSHVEVVQLRGAPLLSGAWGTGYITVNLILIIFSRALGYLECLQ